MPSAPEPSREEKADRFLALHIPGDPLLLPNPWDVGTTVLLASLGFEALATTSSGFAATLGRQDGNISREQALTHAAEIAAATDLPVSADLENGFDDRPAAVADLIDAARDAGLAGGSIEDYAGTATDEIYEPAAATERVAAAVDRARAGDGAFVVTARAENHLHGRHDLDDTVRRLQAYADAGADVVYAPGLSDLDDISRVVRAVEVPVNVLAWPGGPTVSELAGVGVSRISIGGAFSLAAHGAVARAAGEFLEDGTFGFFELAGEGRRARGAFRD